MKKKDQSHIIIPVFFTFDRHYAVAARVAIHSMLTHADTTYQYRLYVLHADIPPSQQQRLQECVSRFPHATLQFIDTTRYEARIEALPQKSHFAKEIFFKLIAAELFPEYDRIICSDVDVVFKGDIAPSFFAYPDEPFYYAGVGQLLQNNRMAQYGEAFTPDELFKLSKEIYAGYLLMNLKYIRQTGIQQQLTSFYIDRYAHLLLPEQDAIIICCHPHVRYLPMKYVVCNSWYSYEKQLQTLPLLPDRDSLPADDTQARVAFADALQHPIQLHYVGPGKPWNALCVPKQSEWFKALWQSDGVMLWIAALPSIFWKKRKQYSLTRFIRKTIRKIIPVV